MNFRVDFTLDGDNMATLLALRMTWKPDDRPAVRVLRGVIADQVRYYGSGTDLSNEIEALWADDEWDERYAAARELIRQAFGE
jgi:hypothetical protein